MPHSWHVYERWCKENAEREAAKMIVVNYILIAEETRDNAAYMVASYPTREMADLHASLLNKEIKQNGKQLKPLELDPAFNPSKSDYRFYFVVAVPHCVHPDQFLEEIQQLRNNYGR